MATTQATTKGTTITIENYNDYQCDGTTEGTTEGTLKEPRRNSAGYTNKNDKNDKNDKKNIYSDLPEELHEPLREYISMRKSIKKTMTDKAILLLIGKLIKLSDGDIQLQISMLEEATMKNWLSVYPPKEEKPKSIYMDVDDYLTQVIKEGMQNESNRYSEDNETNPVTVQKLLQGSR